ncbi:MAG: alpha/beta hydrolase [Spiroplasma sp.]
MKEKEQNTLKVKNKENSVKEIKYHFSWINKILLYITLPFWILPVLIINLIIGKKIRDNLQTFSKKGPVLFPGYEGIQFNSLEFYNREMALKNAPKELLISSEEWIEINPENVDILTFDDITLAAFLLVSKKPTNKWVVVLHGWYQNRYSIIYLAKHFYQAGYNVLVYDSRNHGSNSDTSCTFGLKEAQDLFFVLKYLKQRFHNKNLEFALIGNSMGASTILQALVRYDLTALGVKSAIFDCGYDDFAHMMKILGKTKIKRHWFWYYYGVNFWFYFKDNFKIDLIKPVNKLQNCSKTPVLFIHGSKDQTVPLTMSQRLYHKKLEYELLFKNKKLSELLIIKDAGHIESALTNYPLYTKTTLKFIDKWFKKKIS